MASTITCPDCDYSTTVSTDDIIRKLRTDITISPEANYRAIIIDRPNHDCRPELYTRDITSMKNFETTYRKFVMTTMPRAEVLVRYAQLYGNTATWRELRSIPNRVETSDELIEACLDLDLGDDYDSLAFIHDFTDHMEANA